MRLEDLLRAGAGRRQLRARPDRRIRIQFAAVDLTVLSLPARPQRLELASHLADAPARRLVRPPPFSLDSGGAFDHAAEPGMIAGAAEVPLGIGCPTLEDIAVDGGGGELQLQLQARRRLALPAAEAQVIVIVGGATRRRLVLVLGRPIDVDHLAPAEDLLEAIEDQRVIPFTLLVVLASGGEWGALATVTGGRRRQLRVVVRARRSAAGPLDNPPDRRHQQAPVADRRVERSQTPPPCSHRPKHEIAARTRGVRDSEQAHERRLDRRLVTRE